VAGPAGRESGVGGAAPADCPVAPELLHLPR
jgi:hypothetical protein